MKQHSGFTLVETMVAIAVLAIALVGPFIAVQNALRASYTARDQLIASHLAQEGMEYIRSIRDANYLNSRPWLDGFNSATQNRNRCFSAVAGTPPTGYCTVSPTEGDFHQTAAAMSGYTSVALTPMLKINSSRIYTQQTPNADSRFKRTVQIMTVSATEVQVTVAVSFTTLGQSYTVTVVDNLRDWI